MIERGSIADTETKEVALRAQAFGMKVYYHNRRRLAPKQELSIGSGVKYVSFEELLSKSDVLSLNLGLTKSTRNIIGTPEFNKMKDGVVIVNSARGELIDEEALLAALASGKVRPAARPVSQGQLLGAMYSHLLIVLTRRFTRLVLTSTQTSRTLISRYSPTLGSSSFHTSAPRHMRLKKRWSFWFWKMYSWQSRKEGC